MFSNPIYDQMPRKFCFKKIINIDLITIQRMSNSMKLFDNCSALLGAFYLHFQYSEKNVDIKQRL